MHLIITDSGLGGLGICAAIERAFRLFGGARDVRLTYFNAWPEEGRGYNSLPDQGAQLAYFDRALARMSQLRPDRVVIACNTLSVLFPLTVFAGTAFGATTRIPVLGIIDAGVDLFEESLGADPCASLALFGTRITMESGTHRDRLVQRGIEVDRIVPVACHGLAAAIEKDAGSAEVEHLIDQCASQAAASMAHAGPLFVGLCCTHYGYVADRFRTSLERVSGRTVRILDPNGALVRLIAPAETAGSGSDAPRQTAEDSSLAPDGSARLAHGRHVPHSSQAWLRKMNSRARGAIVVEVISKVALDERTRSEIGRLVAAVSPAAARALQSYTHVPDLF